LHRGGRVHRGKEATFVEEESTFVEEAAFVDNGPVAGYIITNRFFAPGSPGVEHLHDGLDVRNPAAMRALSARSSNSMAAFIILRRSWAANASALPAWFVGS
ncbi:3657_t:CDS:2, partial [Paraglomus brasilianum]